MSRFGSVLRCVVVVYLCGKLVHGARRNVFKTGAVLAESGVVKEIADARRGYELGVKVVNGLNRGKGFAVKDLSGSEYFFKFSFDSMDDASNKTQHVEFVKSLLEGEKPVDFLFGSHPEFVEEETQLSNQHKRINIQCCVGPDEVYQKNHKYVFGVAVSNKRYSQLTIHSMGLKGIKRVGVIYRNDNLFTRTTCVQALKYVEQFQNIEHKIMKVVVEHTYTVNQSTDPTVFEGFVQKCIKNDVEAVLACSFSDDGKLLVEAFHAERKSMKALFMTVGPANHQWVKHVGDSSKFLISAGQWHNGLTYSDDLFGTTAEYNQKYEVLHGHGNLPTYVAAGASAAVYTMMKAIQNAFSECDISLTRGRVDQLLFNSSALLCKGRREEMMGYERVRLALGAVDLNTFFGRIKFNTFRRNIGNDPATTQVLEPGDLDEAQYDAGLKISAVLPVKAATAELVMPGENLYRPTCKPGDHAGPGSFDPCQPCELGKFSSEENVPHCDRCPAGKYVSEIGQSICSSCPKGTTTDGPGATSREDCQCIKDYYNAEGESGVECFKCPSGAECSGGTSLPVPMRGYWMNDTMRGVAYECDLQSVCVGGSDLSCKRGYNGRMCSECSKGYYGVISYCFECPPRLVVVTFMVLVVLGWYVINVVVSQNVASLEMILSWAQLANVIGDVDLRWPSKLRLMFAVANVLDFDVDILEPSCLTNWSFRHNQVVQLLLPFLMSLMAFLGYFSSWMVYRCRSKISATTMDRLDQWLGWLVTIPHSEEELCDKWDSTIAAFLSSIEVTYITVAKYCFDVFKCETIAGVSVLRTASSIECGTQEHRVLMALGVVGTLVYSIGYLGLVSWKIWQLHANRTFHKSHYLKRYGFLYCRFELDYCWTPIVVLGRRLLFVMILVFVNNPGFQAGALAIIINASLMLHVYTTPYVDTYLDVMFSFLLVALMFESFSGVLFYSTNLPSNNRVILEWIVLLILFLLVAISIYFLILELKDKYENHFITQMHCREIMHRKFFASTQSLLLLRMVSSEARDAKKLISGELLETFDSSFLYSAFKKEPQLIQHWDKLNDMLKDFMSDQSECSYLSREPVAKFWRKLVDRFPELVDYLAVANEESRGHFSSFVTTLYRDFYLTNKVRKLPIFGVLNWRDRAPMAQWLAMASEDDRRFFTSFMSDLFEAVGRDPISVFDEKVASEVATSINTEELSASVSSRWDQLGIFKRKGTKQLVLAELNSGRNPLEIHRRPSMLLSMGSILGSTELPSVGSMSTDKESAPESLDCIEENSREDLTVTSN